MAANIFYVVVDGDKWQWAEDYLYASATYTVACPRDRRVQVGMGVMAFGEPRGEKVRFSGEKEITVVGAGALHFRVDDGQGPCKVGFVHTSASLVRGTWRF